MFFLTFQKMMNASHVNKQVKNRKTKPVTILLVDDEPDILTFIGYNLKKEGFRVFVAGNGHEAIDQAKRNHPDLVLLDVMMPGLDGIETCQRLRNIPELSKTIIAFLSARSQIHAQMAGYYAGGDDYIAKPIGPQQLIKRVKGLLNRDGIGD